MKDAADAPSSKGAQAAGASSPAAASPPNVASATSSAATSGSRRPSDVPPARDGELSRTLRVLLSLPELEFRVRWLADRLDHLPLEGAAELLDALCVQAGRSDPAAREVLISVALYFAALEEPSP